jgi:putative transposase
MPSVLSVSEVCSRLGLPAPALAVIESIRTAPPSRRVQSAHGNVTARYPSRKMGVTIQAESHQVELPAIYLMEYDEHILEYYDQPPPIKLNYLSKDGKPVGVLHTPDFFVIRDDWIGWEEWKPESKLKELTVAMPNRYVRDEPANRWHCPPGERYAEKLALAYRVRSDAEIDWILQRNLHFLEDYWREASSPISEAVAGRVVELTRSDFGITLAALLALAQAEHIRSDAINQLIATHRLFVDLRLAPLAEPERVHVFPDSNTAAAFHLMLTTRSDPMPGPVAVTVGAWIRWDNFRWRILNLGETTVTLLSEDGVDNALPREMFEQLIRQGALANADAGDPNELPAASPVHAELNRTSPDEWRVALERYHLLKPLLENRPPAAEAPSVHASTLRRWRQRYRQAEQQYGLGLMGLLARFHACGNRNLKLPEASHQLMAEIIEREYETLQQRRKRFVYGQLVAACEQRGLVAPSYPTFMQAIRKRPQPLQIEKREGPRAAYPHTPFYWELELTTPRHGDRAFEIGHIDHTELDLELICSQTGRPLGRAWLTLLIDAYSRRILALWLTFDPPSYRSCMMVLRECVRRHGHLPHTVVVDGAREFKSVYFETLLARYSVTQKTRPWARPRFGSVCERLFGTANSTFVHNLMGNTQIMRKVRQATRMVWPQNLATWTLPVLHQALCEWAYEIYDTNDHPALGQTPRQACEQSLERSGERPHLRIPYTQDFIMMTLPSTRKATARVHPTRGILIHSIYYWSETFRQSSVANTDVWVRYDPFDVGVAYAYVNHCWVRCWSQYYTKLRGRSEKELSLITQELKKRQTVIAARGALTAAKLARFLESAEANLADLLVTQRLKDAAGGQIRALIEPVVPRSEAAVGERVEDRPATPEPGHPPMAVAPSSPDALVVYGDY